MNNINVDNLRVNEDELKAANIKKRISKTFYLKQMNLLLNIFLMYVKAGVKMENHGVQLEFLCSYILVLPTRMN